MFSKNIPKQEPSPKVEYSLTQEALAAVIEKCVVGAKIFDICEFGDKLIVEECAKTYTGKKIDKGVAFPVCISVNEICGHYSPMAEDLTVLAAGDVAKM